MNKDDTTDSNSLDEQTRKAFDNAFFSGGTAMLATAAYKFFEGSQRWNADINTVGFQQEAKELLQQSSEPWYESRYSPENAVVREAKALSNAEYVDGDLRQRFDELVRDAERQIKEGKDYQASRTLAKQGTAYLEEEHQIDDPAVSMFGFEQETSLYADPVLMGVTAGVVAYAMTSYRAD